MNLILTLLINNKLLLKILKIINNTLTYSITILSYKYRHVNAIKISQSIAKCMYPRIK